MGIIAEVKENLSIGAPKVRSKVAKIHTQPTAASIQLPLTLVGGHTPAHVKTLRITLWAQSQDQHGHTAYAIHTRVTLTNGDTGWALAPKQRIELAPDFNLGQPTPHAAPLLINITADVGRNTDNPSTTITLHLS